MPPIALASPVLETPPRRGRPPDAAKYPAKYQAQLRWAYLVRSGQVLVKEAARANRVSRRTILRWVVELETSDHPIAAELRWLVARGLAENMPL